MAVQPRDHPSSPSPAALLLVDLVNPMDFDGAQALLPPALDAARAITALKRRTRAAGMPTIFVNDNFDQWHMGFRELVEHHGRPEAKGRALIERVEPDAASDHFVLKPMHSGFFQTPLEVLLQRLGVRTVVVTGVAADICVWATAHDAYMRDYRVVLPSDCIASERPEWTADTLVRAQRVLHADTRPSTALDLDALTTPAAE
ncbi:MAG TPA: isochorismatase family cysteine hydrolase [Candidatus Binatia bacterium]|jgi:nicotinamidase-related amidase|nr:isochorismatase family cysteine hydrolase [Candidatus Binatia bacterium]